MKKISLIVLTMGLFHISFSQATYMDSLKTFRDEYIKTHAVVKEQDKKYLQFYPVNEKLKIECRFERKENSPWFLMATSGPVKQTYRIYGKLYFTLNDTAVTLCVYQSRDLMKTTQYKDFLFMPFLDATTGEETYESGRYIDLFTTNIISDKVVIDFNRAYNPYCAYTTGYNCPVPPKENRLPVAIKAGEKKYLKAIH
jgi:uncharacterized protein (DUF1684 family)